MQDNTDLEAFLTNQELQVTFTSIENVKTPRLDGVPVEFYRTFWTLVSEDLLEVLNDSILRGKLSLSCRTAVLTLFPKNGDLCNLKN